MPLSSVGQLLLVGDGAAEEVVYGDGAAEVAGAEVAGTEVASVGVAVTVSVIV